MKTNDSALKTAVLRELRWDTRVDPTDIHVEVDSGTVKLTGSVGTWAMRFAAQEAAHRVRDVLDVVNDVEVRIHDGGRQSDIDIAKAVRQALEWDVLVPDTRIRSTVSDGWVTLEGDVDLLTQIEDAGRAIRNLAGVRGVSNELIVRPSKVHPQDVRSAIEEALERQAGREAKHIQLEVQDGRVTLSGVVHSWHERKAVIGAARGTPGVRLVDDHLRLEPYSA